MNRFKPVNHCASLLGLVLLLLPACGGGGSSTSTPPDQATTPPVHATTLTYSNPPATGYSLQADPASTNAGHLTLNLVGPAGTSAQGVSVFLSADPAAVSWSKATPTSYATPGTVFNLGSGPQAFISKATATGDLQIGIYQKSGSITYTSAPIATLGLDLDPGSVSPGTVITLVPTPGTRAVFIDQTGTVQPMTTPIGIGKLVAN